jgi:hypothetical protein
MKKSNNLRNTAPTIYYRLRPHAKSPQNGSIHCTIKKGKTTLATFSTNIKIPLFIWVQDCNMISHTEAHKEKFFEFENLKKNISQIVQNLHKEKENFTKDELKELLFKEEAKYMFSDLKEKILLHYTALIAKGEVKKSVLIHAKQYIKKFENFLKFESLTNKNLCNFDLKDAEIFCDYLRKNTNLQPNTRRKTIQNLKKFFKYACKWSMINKSPFEYIELPRHQKKPLVFLTEQEIEILERSNIKNESLERVKDLYLFQCYTGLCYGDMFDLIHQKTEFVKIEQTPQNEQGFPAACPITLPTNWSQH